MAFTGYVFNDLNHISPHLENADSGPTVTWARRQALRLSAFVVVGYPQILKEQGGIEKHYNSACFVGREGNLIATYQKSFLYETDERWADEGPGFKCWEVDGLGKVIISTSLYVYVCVVRANTPMAKIATCEGPTHRFFF